MPIKCTVYTVYFWKNKLNASKKIELVELKTIICHIACFQLHFMPQFDIDFGLVAVYYLHFKKCSNLLKYSVSILIAR